MSVQPTDTIPELAVVALRHSHRYHGKVLPEGTKGAVVHAYRRTETGFVREVYEGLDAVIPLGEIEIELPLAEIYAGVEFTPEPSDEA